MLYHFHKTLLFVGVMKRNVQIYLVLSYCSIDTFKTLKNIYFHNIKTEYYLIRFLYLYF